MRNSKYILTWYNRDMLKEDLIWQCNMTTNLKDVYKRQDMIFCFYGFDPQEEIQNMAHPYHSNTDSSDRHILHSKKADRHHNRYHPVNFTFRSYRHRPMLYEAVEMLLI